MQGLNNIRRELFQDYLDLLRRDEPGSPNPAVQDASMALIDCYWRDRKRLPRLGVLSHLPDLVRRRWWRGVVAELHPPYWKHQVTCEVWDSLDKTTLYWSDPLPEAEIVATSVSGISHDLCHSQHL